MATIDLFDLPPSGPLIGIDPGSKTLGIAACDAGRLVMSCYKEYSHGYGNCKILQHAKRLWLHHA